MELRFTKEQQELQHAIRQFAAAEIASAVPMMESEERFPVDLIRRMAERQWMGIPIPKLWGGAGKDFISYIIAINEVSKVSAAVGVILSVHSSVCTLPILNYGSDQQRQQFVRKLASGEWIGAFALTEPHAGSDAAAIRTSAARKGEDYELNGSKLFITNAGAAGVYLLFAVTDAAKRAGGISAFIVPGDTEGLHIGKPERKMGLHGSNTCELHFEQLRIPAEYRLGREGEGFAIAKGSLDGGRIGIAAQALGIAEAAMLLLRKRLQLPKGKLLTHRHAELAELMARTEAARLLVYRAASLRQDGRPCTKEASMAKMFASDTAVAVTGAAVRLLGAEGLSRDHPAERLFRDAKVTQIYEGTNEIHRIVISGRLMK
ncbi:acyl-CoA dehydrogenase family protein [Paenibacillus glycanilyticus]|uniref:acyl-CoA dehydrogenase family protein n=1 Tax=Paenibacillus glycanilyticus TaxID=126569 RepID=UPI00203AE4D9|nr:acyl-CoA dehydrogenase family protein [Paenibacillus glycanilyticus]MCM3628614.1 acyl-CoA dehydrogenase family protein [Paenibacillus glycanilyticus]